MALNKISTEVISVKLEGAKEAEKELDRRMEKEYLNIKIREDSLEKEKKEFMENRAKRMKAERACLHREEVAFHLQPISHLLALVVSFIIVRYFNVWLVIV